ncbi:MAG TPA: extracellular solute-binding protein [Hyphomicrobiaceae bacterium]|nr:extracellular solute-binding protein [Hyphomicrobiaceae bacterium]
MRLGVQGSFDSVNPLIFKGDVASGVRDYVYESLLVRSSDEPFSLYGHLARSIEMPPDRGWATFRLRDTARFANGTPLTARDVAFSHALLRDKGWPFMRASYGRVRKVEIQDERVVHFDFGGARDRELPLLIGLMPILSEAATEPSNFEQTTLTPPIGSGPYRIASLEAGRTIVYRRDPEWWARDLPQMRGRHNFDEIRFEYFRDSNTMFEAFKAGDIDVMIEDDPGRWSRGYDFPALREGRVVKRELELRSPAPMSGLAFNTRRPVFADARVRRALNLAFDAEWLNASLFAGLLARTQSYFARSELSSHGRPASDRERALLGRHIDAIEPAILDGSWKQPVSDGTGSNRANQRAAVDLLRAAGYRLVDGVMTNQTSGRALTFEILLNSRRQERLVLAYVASLAAIGITARPRVVDSAQYELRLKSQDFDMIQSVWQSSLSPGNEQRNRWGSASADAENTRNYAGVRSPAADAMIDAMVSATTAEDFTAAVRAFDRILLSGHYVIPLFHPQRRWVAHWTRIAGPIGDGRPATNAGLELDSWWANPG